MIIFFADVVICLWRVILGLNSFGKNFKIPSFLGCSKLVSVLPAMNNVHLQFSTKPTSAATFIEALQEVCWYLPLILKPKNIRTVLVAPSKAYFFAFTKRSTWVFGPALEISFYIQLSKYRSDGMQRT